KGIYNTKGNVLLPVEYDIIKQYYGNPYALVRKEGKWSYINSAGKLICEPIYDELYSFSRGYATVVLNGKQGLMHTSGKMMLAPKYDLVYYNRSRYGYIDVKENGLCGLMNFKGEWVCNPKYTSIGKYNNEGIAIVMLETNGIRHYGIINTKGKEIVPPNYDELLIDNLRINATKNGAVVQYTLQGECLNCD
ncbi:MAG: WG repeat-containing protein, partial [Bacteroidia bacterium]